MGGAAMTGNLSYIVRAIVITSFAVSSMLSAAEVPSPAAIAGNAKLPLDPAVRTGKLRNGLTYYVRRNTRPEKRADIWLAVNAGSTLEDEDQRGLAHFCLLYTSPSPRD